jgi:hypothetical protein
MFFYKGLERITGHGLSNEVQWNMERKTKTGNRLRSYGYALRKMKMRSEILF